MSLTGNIPPAAQLQDAVKLEADGIVDLFQIELTSGGIIRVKDNESATWNGSLWEFLPVKLTGLAWSSDEQVARPTLVVANPEGAFSLHVAGGAVDNAIVRRLRVLYDDFRNNRARYLEEVWYCSRVISLTRQTISLELRTLSDRVNAVLPARMFVPPEFNLVTLQ